MKTGQHPRQIRSRHCKAASQGVAQLQRDEQLCLAGRPRAGHVSSASPPPPLSGWAQPRRPPLREPTADSGLSGRVASVVRVFIPQTLPGHLLRSRGSAETQLKRSLQPKTPSREGWTGKAWITVRIHNEPLSRAGHCLRCLPCIELLESSQQAGYINIRILWRETGAKRD